MANQVETNQSPQVVTDEIATIDQDITRALFYGGTSQILDQGDEIIRSRGGGKGLRLYDEIERDAHAGAVLGKRFSAVTHREWKIDPASDDPIDKEIAETLRQWLIKLRFDKVTRGGLKAILKGLSAGEVIWERQGRFIVPAKVKPRAPDRFRVDVPGQWRLLTRQHPYDGEVLPDRKFILHLHDADDDYPYGKGIGRQLFWPTFFKRQNMSFWLIFNEKFASPTAVGKYPSGASKEQQNKLLSALRAISQQANVIIPEKMTADLLEATRSGSVDAYERLTRYLDEQISEAVLGETLTTTVGSTGGNRALGQVHEGVRQDLAKDDADAYSETINETLIKWCVEFNWPGRTPPTLWRDFSEPEDRKSAAETDEMLDRMGWRRTRESMLETYGPGYEPKPTPTASTSSAMLDFLRAPGSRASEGTQEFSEPGLFAKLGRAVARAVGFAEADPVERQKAIASVDQDEMAEAATLAAAEWQTITGPRVERLIAMFDEAGDYDEVRRELDRMIEEAPTDAAVERLARAQFIGRLAGRVPRV